MSLLFYRERIGSDECKERSLWLNSLDDIVRFIVMICGLAFCFSFCFLCWIESISKSWCEGGGRHRRGVERRSRLKLWSIPKPEFWSDTEPELRSIPELELRSIPERKLWSISKPELWSVTEPELRSIPEPELRSTPNSDPDCCCCYPGEMKVIKYPGKRKFKYTGEKEFVKYPVERKFVKYTGELKFINMNMHIHEHYFFKPSRCIKASFCISEE